MSEWKPIETAPDRQWILVYEERRAKNQLGCGVFPLIQIDGVWYEHWHGDALIGIDSKPVIYPSHWMPLPEPPNDRG